jgi:hypothetical protein
LPQKPPHESAPSKDVRLRAWIGLNLELRTFAAMWTMDVADTKKAEYVSCEFVSVIGYVRIIESTGTNMR